jgi:hypothetical protein
VHNDFPNADLQKVSANKIKPFQACILVDARVHHFEHLLQVHSEFPNALYFLTFLYSQSYSCPAHKNIHSDKQVKIFATKKHPGPVDKGQQGFYGGE